MGSIFSKENFNNIGEARSGVALLPEGTGTLSYPIGVTEQVKISQRNLQAVASEAQKMGIFFCDFTVEPIVVVEIFCALRAKKGVF
ncbi:hypothetical protein HYU14_02125 [Candidatus Woesearchaeota archaeon]|nr:hypothetical protein [Candidatus Woesearchaeota archaeon]